MAYWFKKTDCNLDDFKTSMAEAKAADTGSDWTKDAIHGVPVYDCDDLRSRLVSDAGRESLKEDMARIFRTGAGIVILKKCFSDIGVVDEATEIFNQIMAEEKAAGAVHGDHFGTNARIWNAAEKLCMRAPGTFVKYYSNEIVALVSEAWLGPNYQVTSQTNLVHPGGKGQTGHRDYHLGFMEQDEAVRYPVLAHQFSAFLTLQGAVAHCDMPIESGPTKYLPYSQLYEPGYVAATLPEFQAYFDTEYVQMPLDKGDAVFFNPAVLHGAGDNVTTDVERLANLMQVSSAFGRAIETVDRAAMCKAIYPELLARKGDLSAGEIDAAICACAEGYPFPTSLDRDPPLDGLVPKSQADIMRDALSRPLKFDALTREIDANSARRACGI